MKTFIIFVFLILTSCQISYEHIIDNADENVIKHSMEFDVEMQAIGINK